MDFHYLRTDQEGDMNHSSAGLISRLLVGRFRPERVLDLGCGTGVWLAAFRANGVNQLVGADGAWVPLDRLEIPGESFREVNFEADIPDFGRFDLAVSLEVAEHLSPNAGDRLVEALTKAADLVLWSAAIPGQGGIGHINEQAPEHWISRFAERGFTAHDVVRPAVWRDPTVAFWYQQNCYVFANEAARVRHGLAVIPFVASFIHPELFARECDPRNYSLKTVVRHLPHYLTRRFRSRA